MKTSDEELRYTLRHTKVTAYAQGKAYNVNLATVIQKGDIDELMRIIKAYTNSEITAVLDRLEQKSVLLVEQDPIDESYQETNYVPLSAIAKESLTNYDKLY